MWSSALEDLDGDKLYGIIAEQIDERDGQLLRTVRKQYTDMAPTF